MNSLVTIVFSNLLAAALATPFTNYGSSSTLNSVTISGCETTPCVLQRGGQVNLTVEWASHATINNLYGEALVVLNGNLIRVPALCDANQSARCSGCPDLIRGDCPLESAEVAAYSRTVHILSSWPVVICNKSNPAVPLIFFTLRAEALSTSLTDCGSISVLNLVTISGCDTIPFVLQRGSKVNLTIEWTFFDNFCGEALVVFSGSLGRAPILCHASRQVRCSGCPDLIVRDCPLEPAEVATYFRTVHIHPSWPIISSPVHGIFKIAAKPTNEGLVCFIVPSVIS